MLIFELRLLFDNIVSIMYSDDVTSASLSDADDDNLVTRELLDNSNRKKLSKRGASASLAGAEPQTYDTGTLASPSPRSVVNVDAEIASNWESTDEKVTMTESKKTPCFVYMLTFLSAIGGFLFGYDTGVVAGALLLLKDSFSLTSVWQEAFISVTMGFAAFFAIVGGYLNDITGRKPTIILASIVFTAGAVLLALSNQRWMLVTGRCILGIGIGFTSSTVSIYIAECAPSHLRGQLVTLNNAFITGGQFVASVIDGLFSKDLTNGWRFMLGLAAIPSFLQFVGFLFMPETPRFLMKKGRRDEARRLLVRIRGYEDVEQEVEEIQRNVDESDSEAGVLRMLTTPHVRRALIVGCMLQIFQQITGINTVMYYSATIIRMSGVSSTSSAIWLASITAAVNFVFTFVGFFLVERIGRRPLTLVSLTGTMFSLIVLGAGFQLAAVHSPPVDFSEVLNTSSACSNYTKCNNCMLDNYCGYCYVSSPMLAANGSCLAVAKNAYGDPLTGQSASGRCSGQMNEQLHWAYDYCPSSYSWMATFGLILYLIFFAPGMGPMPWTINSEIYPLWARSRGNSIATCVNWLSNLLISMTFLTLTEAITRHGAFYLYSGFAFLGIVFIGLCLPETKGKQLEEVEELFQQPLISCGSKKQYERVVS